jgi:hypothetical protein
MGLCSNGKSDGICINLTSSGFRPTCCKDILQYRSCNIKCLDVMGTDISLLIFVLTISMIRYCPTTYTPARTTNRDIPQKVVIWLLTMSEILLIDTSMISAIITIKNVINIFLLSYRDIVKAPRILFPIILS